MNKLISLSNKQDECYSAALHFLLNSNDLIYIISGVAGSGKTTIISKLNETLRTLGVNVFNMALTGKAVSVMRERGVTNCGTIHSLIYEAVFDDATEEFVGFVKRDVNAIRDQYNCMIVDESSMISSALFKDITAIGIPVLFIGDSEQLPAIDNEIKDFNIMAYTNIHLTEIHRQALDNPIIQLATDIRETGRFNKNKFKDQNNIRFINNSDVTRDVLKSIKHDIILCGTNRKRESLNRLARSVHGFDDVYPEVGEQIICLQNDVAVDMPIYNGEIYKIKAKYPANSNKTVYVHELKSIDGNKKLTSRIRNESWDGVIPKRGSGENYFDYGYCISVWKAQGSEFDSVIFYDEDVSNFVNRRRFRYTAVTRAANKITIIT